MSYLLPAWDTREKVECVICVHVSTLMEHMALMQRCFMVRKEAVNCPDFA